jgi:NAD(P)-dependent dehydrogenase (short-subunit alcohol dehydrogenase family)
VAASGSDDQGSPFHLVGRVAVVTGGTRGIGLGIARGLLAAGAEVVVCGRSEVAEVDLPGAVGVDGVARTAAFVAADIRHSDQAAAVVAVAVERWGRLDVLVNNAGGSPEADAATASPRFATSIVTLNLLAPLFCAQAANAVMQTQEEGGSIINIGSVSGMRPSPGTSAYGAAKAGLINLTQTLAVEWAPRVRVNCVSAGLVAKDEVDVHYGGAEGFAAVAATVPLGRFGRPDDLTPLCLFLASPELSGYVSGSNLVVHGGGEWPSYMAATDRSRG